MDQNKWSITGALQNIWQEISRPKQGEEKFLIRDLKAGGSE